MWSSVPGPRRLSLGEDSRLSWLCHWPRWASGSPSARSGLKSCLHPGLPKLLHGDGVPKARRCGPGTWRAHLCPEPTACKSGGSGTCAAEGWAAKPRSPGLNPETSVSNPGGRDPAGASPTSCCGPAGLDHPGPHRGQAGRDTGRLGGKGRLGGGGRGRPPGPLCRTVRARTSRDGQPTLNRRGRTLGTLVEGGPALFGRRWTTPRAAMSWFVVPPARLQHVLSASRAQGARGRGRQAHLSALTAVLLGGRNS